MDKRLYHLLARKSLDRFSLPLVHKPASELRAQGLNLDRIL